MNAKKIFGLVPSLLLPLIAWADEKAFDASGIVQISIDVEKSDVRIEASTTDKITISADKLDDAVSVLENSIAITDRLPMASSRRYLGPVIKVVVKPDIRASIKTVSGDITVRGLAAAVRAATSSGDVTVDNCSGTINVNGVSGDLTIGQANKDIEVRSVSGDIKVTRADGPLVELQGVSGDIRIENSSSPRLRVRSVSGDINIRATPPAEATLEVSTVSGDVGLWINKTAGFELAFSSMSGDFHNDFTAATIEQVRRKVTLRTGDASISIKVSTVSGDLSLRRLP